MKGKKICNIQEPDELRSVLIKSGDLSCSICCARSDDPSTLCSPVQPSTPNLFCDP